jgi:hypothetical protein
MQEEMYMRVDQPRHQRRIAEINDRRSGRPRDMCSRLANALAHNEHFTRRKHLAVNDIKDARCMQNCDVSRGLLSLGG